MYFNLVIDIINTQEVIGSCTKMALTYANVVLDWLVIRNVISLPKIVISLSKKKKGGKEMPTTKSPAPSNRVYA